MCSFCEGCYQINTTIGDNAMCLRIDENQKNILRIRIKPTCRIGELGVTKPIKINYCPFCGDKLDIK